MADERTPWIGVSQYKTAREYKEPKTLETFLCKYTCTMPSTEISFKGIEHAGVITHKCFLSEGHSEECICLCGYKFKGWK